MRTGHCNEEPAIINQLQIPGGVERDLLPVAGLIEPKRLAARSSNRLYLLYLEINLSNEVIFGVGNVEHPAVRAQGEPLRMIEFCSLVVAVGPAGMSVADEIEQFTIEV